MLEMIDIGLEEAVAYRIGGKITEMEMAAVLSAFKERIADGKKLRVYQEVVSLGGVEIDALMEKLKFFKEFGLSHFSRIAMVTPKRWIHKLVDLEGKLFKNIEMKGFSIEDRDKAIQFLKGA